MRDEDEGLSGEDRDQNDSRDRRIALKKRLKEYGLRILKLYDSLPKYGAIHIVTHQLARAGTSPGAQYREACRAKSDADFISKIEGAIQELDESDYWLEMLVDGKYVPDTKLASLVTETNELTAIFVSMVKRVKSRRKK